MSTRVPEDGDARAPVRWPVVRYVVGVIIGVAVLFVLYSQRGDLSAVAHEMAHLDPSWMAASMAAQVASILAFSYLQRIVLASGDTTIGVARLFAVSLANNAIALTVPGEPAVSSAYRYREYRRHGASAALAGWTILTIMIGQAIGLSLLLLTGVVVTLAAGTHGDPTGVAVVGLLIVVAAGAVLVRRDLILATLEGVVRIAQRVSGHPTGGLSRRVSATLRRMREMRPRRAATIGIVALATLTWSLDLACLLCAFAAVRAPIPHDAVVLAYGVAQVVAVLPIVPGGLGLVEGSLAVVLVAYGAARVPTLSAVLAYRLVDYWLAVAVGWLAVGLLALGDRTPRGASPGTDPHVG